MTSEYRNHRTDFVLIALIVFVTAIAAAAPSHASTLDTVRDRGYLRCGTTENGRGLGTIEASGRWVGFFPDICRAIAAAVLGNPDYIEFINVSVGNRFDALRDGGVDLLSESSTWTLSRDGGLGLTFPALAVFDGQGFMVHESTGIKQLADLHGATICSQTATTTVANLRDYDRAHGMDFEIIEFSTMEGSYSAFFYRQCIAVSDDSTALASVRQTQAPNPADYRILPEIISKEPLGPVTRDDDAQWTDIVRWSVLVLIAAEEKGITAESLEQMKQEGNAEVRRLLGTDGEMGRFLGLDDGWAARAIAAGGNYGELFERHLGHGSPLNLDRGPNRPWTSGGVLWAPPIR